MTASHVYLCLGSNVGERAARIAEGIAGLERAGVSVTARSSIYETEPVGVEDQSWFLNQVVGGTTRLDPTALLDACKRIEGDVGRKPSTLRFGPRSLDIDILLYGTDVIVGERLTVPHPRMHERRFMLVPLVEIAPRLVDPRDGEAYADILERLDEGKKVLKSLPNES